MPVFIIGTLDTKGREVAFLRDILQGASLEIVTIDAGSLGPPTLAPDIPREQVFEAAGTTISEVRQHRDRGQAVAAAARGVAALIAARAAEDQVGGVIALGGSAGTTIGTSAMRAVPFGVPKVMVSTLASGQTRPYVGGSDIMMVPAIADIAGMNRLTRQVLTNAAHAMIGMVRGREAETIADVDPRSDRLITATMFGVTTPCVDHARATLERNGFEVIVFHATGVGGQAMETLIRDGLVSGVLDLTTTELADELVGGVLSAGPDRLSAAVRAGLPQVVSVGALDMVNFGPMESVPERFRTRSLHVHNPNVTLMRTTAEECDAIGAHMARLLRNAHAETVVMIPEGGVSALDAPGQPFHDPDADAALFEAIRQGLKGATHVRVESLAMHINDPAFGKSASQTLMNLIATTRR